MTFRLRYKAYFYCYNRYQFYESLSRVFPEIVTGYHDHFEYFGNEEIERISRPGEKVIKHDWINFDTVDEAMEFFNDRCGEFVGYYA